MPKYSIYDPQNRLQEIEVDLADYRAASDSGKSLSEHLAGQYPVNTAHGTVVEQMMASCNLLLSADPTTGMRPPTLKEVFDGSVSVNLSGAVRGDGNDRNSVAGRLLFPEVVLQAVQSELTEDNGDFLGGYNQMIAQTASITSSRFDQPVINTTAPRDSEAQPISQGTEPPIMVNISVSERTFRVPTKSIGLMITDEALSATTLDLVNLALTAQSRQERIRTVEGQIGGMVQGDVDVGEQPLQAKKASFYDDSITDAGVITQRAWVKFLRNDYRKRSLGALIMDLDTAFAIENRRGKPTRESDDPQSDRIDTLFTLQNLGLPNPRVLLVEPEIIGANTIVGLDTRYAIRRVINVSAAYSAIENFVMRKATGFRIDFGEMSHKLYPDAWDMLTLTR